MYFQLPFYSVNIFSSLIHTADYEYGAVSSNATPILVIGMLVTIVLAAVVPGFLSIGDVAKRQQEKFEEEGSFKGNLKFSKTPTSKVATSAKVSGKPVVGAAKPVSKPALFGKPAPKPVAGTKSAANPTVPGKPAAKPAEKPSPKPAATPAKRGFW